MSVVELIKTLREKNIEISVDNGQLRVRGSKLALDNSDLLDRVRQNKQKLISELESGTHVSSANGLITVPPNLIPVHCKVITPEMLPLVKLSQSELDRVVATVGGGAANVQDIYPLAPLQEGILFHHLLGNGSDVYLLSTLISIDSRELLNRYIGVLQAVINRHDVLRTAVVWEGLPEPVQVVWLQAPLAVEEIALDPADGDIAEQLRARFDPRRYPLDVRQAPMWRLFVAEDVPNRRWVMLELVHHLISDHTTGELLYQEIESHLLGREDQLPPSVPFRNFVVQARLGVSREEHEAFFSGMLGDVDEPTAPFGLTNVQGDGSRAVEAHQEMDADLCRRLRARARALGVSVASICHLAWAQVLARVSGRDDVVFGTMMFGRMHGGTGVDRALGLFINTLPVRIQVGNEGVQASVRKTHELLTQLIRHEHAPLALAQRCSAVRAPAPLFTAMMNYRYEAPGDQGNPEFVQHANVWAGIEVLRREERINYPIGVAVNDSGEALSVDVQADQSIDARQVCALMLTALESLVTALERAPATPVRLLPVLPPSERNSLLSLGNGGPGAASTPGCQDGCLYDLIEAQALRTPDAIAIVEPGRELTYRQLMRCANGLAEQLKRFGAGPETRVAFLADRSAESVAGMLGILAAGAAYVPFDPMHPTERLTSLLNRASVSALLTPAALRDRANQLAAQCPTLENRILVISEAQPIDERPVSEVSPDNAAYVIYTSGTAGTPKGVVVDHRSATNLVHAFLARHDFAGTRLLVIPPLVFDASVGDVFPILAAGSTLILHPEPTALNSAELQQFCGKFQVTAIDAPAALWRRWTEEFASNRGQATDRILPTVRLMMIGGESVPLDQVRRFTRLTENRIVLSNHYGPTETTVCATLLATCDGAEFHGADLPMGKPLPGVRVYILDQELQLLPRGVEGELYIGGVGVARGYLGDSELTAKSFRRDPFSQEEGARIYATGDIVRWNSDGTLQFLGRRDHQVKIRGFRIELGEIEARLAGHPDVREAAVLAREDNPGDKRLVAYVTTAALEDGTVPALDIQGLRAHLSAVLPEYMVPAAYVQLERLPLTANGKLDCKALPAPEAKAYITREYEAPVGEVEETLARAWTEVLKVERVGRNDNFFELGGHSLLAVTLISRLRQTLAIEVAVRDLFAHPVLSGFAQALKAAARSEQLPIVPVSRVEALPLSFAQQRLWFLAQMEGGSEAYHIPLGLRLTGLLNRDALKRALDRIVWRHEALRTSFERIGDQTVQRIAPQDTDFALLEHDLRGCAEQSLELERRMREEAGAPFDLAHGPLIRGQLIRLGEEEHVLAITMHHIVSDGWSMGVLTGELNALYGAYSTGKEDPLPSLSVQYADYAVWQRQWLAGEELQRQSEYWQRTLDGAPALLELPADRPRPPQQEYAGDVVSVELDAELTRGLKALSQRHGATLYMTLLAAWATVLSRLSGQAEVVIGTPVANRTRAELEGLIGFFVNTQALRVAVTGTAGELLEQVKGRALDAQEHQDLPFEQVIEAIRPPRSLSYTPIFQVMLAWQNNDEGALNLPGLTPSPADAAYRIAKFDLELELSEAGDRIVGGLRYATSLFDRGTIERHAGYLRRVLEAMVADEREEVDRIDLLGEAERHQLLVEWNDTGTEYPQDQCIHELFEEQAARTPDAIAVVCEGTRVSYAELNERSNRLAHYLVSRGVQPDTYVAICMERSVEMVVALLATLKAGGAYVPLDPDYPTERLKHMLEDCTPGMVLTQAKLLPLLGPDMEAVVVDGMATEWAQLPAVNLKPASLGLHARQLAYLIYTSGSTGQPKGVMVEHAAAVNRLRWMQDAYGLQTEEPVLQKTPFSFDVSVWEFFWTLLYGATLVLAKPQGHKDPAYLIELIERERITTLHFVPSMLQVFLEYVHAGQCSSLRRVVCSGEALPAALADRCLAALPGAALHNLYGPTEAAVDVSYHECVSGDLRLSGGVPIGRPVANTSLYVLDAHRQPVPVGVAGELYIGGVQVARGYWNRPDLTAERFPADPYGREPQDRMYRTGDVARWLSNGEIEYLGRNDHQVKIRGFRIELGEIETRLGEHPSVREAVVLAREDQPGDKRLVAYLTAAGGAVPDLGIEALRAHLAAALPEYMVPAAYVRMERFPLTPNGKLDRKALPAPEAGAYLAREYEAPVGEVENTLARIWAEVLKLDRVGRDDNFFELGGHSLLVVTLISRLRQTLAIEVAVKVLFAHPVLSGFARALKGAVRIQQLPIVPVSRAEPLPLSFAQQRLWFLAQMKGGSEAYHMPFELRLTGHLNRDALKRALDRIVWRHEALRTSFERVEGQTVQRIADPDTGFALLEHDLRGHREAALELDRRMSEEAYRPFDLAHGPLIRGQLIRLGEEEHVLAITMHHIVSDGWSMGVLTGELNALYGAYSGGQEDPLPSLAIQYADYAVWQRQWLAGEELQRQSEYWRRTLEGAPALLELPADRPRPAQQDYAGDVVWVDLDAELTRGLKTLSRRHGATLYMTLLAGWATVLSRLSGQAEVVIGTPVANRTRAELEGLIGFFVNTQALRVAVKGTAGELLEQVKERALDAQEHQDLPFEQVIEAVRPPRSLSHTPIFQVMLAWQNADEGTLNLPGLRLSPAGAAYRIAKFDLELELSEAGDRIVGGLRYAEALFDHSTIERYAGYLRRVLEAMVADERQEIDRIDLLGDAERHQLLIGRNETPKYAQSACVHELFEEQEARTPDAIAVVYEGRTLTYGELNRQANRLAHHLIGRGVKPDTHVAICVERSLEMVVGILAILKAGGAYVPLDPAYPAGRLAYMLEDCSPAVLLVNRSRAVLEPGAIPVLDLQADAKAWAEEPESNPGRERMGLDSGHLAYIIYTSGSTGAPKGVMVEHANVARLLSATQHWFQFGSEDVWTLFHSYAFDFSVWEIWGALAYGGRLVVVPQETTRSPRDFYGLLCAEGVTVLNQTPSAFRQLIAAQGESEGKHRLRWVVFGGEALEVSMLKPWYQRERNRGTKLVNMYGITETTVHVTYRELAEADTLKTGASPIGVRIPDLRIYILDGQRRAVPVGVDGELYVGGGGVARGYLKRPELNAERFIADPFCQEAGARMYKTGDVARWLANGEMEYLGRNDQQVKIRGFRIELGEIEARLGEHGSVREAVVVAREEQAGDKRLVAYVTTAGGGIEVESLRQHLRAVLPEYMVPAAYVRLEEMPLTGNGKLDRKALPAPEGDAYGRREYEAPVGEVEKTLAGVWAEVLKLERVGRNDNFFELGGHSLLILRMMTLLQQVGIETTVTELFNRSTIASLATSIRSGSGSAQNVGALQIRSGKRPPIFLTHDGYGDELYFSALARYLPADLPVYGLPSVPFIEPQLHSVSAMARRMVSLIREVQPAGPYKLAGWSFGGVLAYEIARQLLDQAEEVEFLALIDAFCPQPGYVEDAPHNTPQAVLKELCERELEVRSRGPAAATTLGAPELDEDFDTLFLRCRTLDALPEYFVYLSSQEARARCQYLTLHTRAMDSYHAMPLGIPVQLFVASERPPNFPAIPSPSLGWNRCIPEHLLELWQVPGTHESMMRPPHIEVLGRQLTQALATAVIESPRPASLINV